MAEIEIGILQCLARCLEDQASLTTQVAAWQCRRNAARCGIEWSFTRRDADRKLGRHSDCTLEKAAAVEHWLGSISIVTPHPMRANSVWESSGFGSLLDGAGSGLFTRYLEREGHAGVVRG